MKNKLIPTFSAAVAFVYFFTNVAMAHVPETNLWAERRRHTENSRTKNQDNVLLASLSSIPTVPEMSHSIALSHTALSEDMAKTLPKSFVAQHADLFGALPTAHGTIRKVWLPAGGPGKRVVVHIQDVHQNKEAQQHIAGAVESLLHAHQAGLVALEGAFAPIDVKAYHDFEDREVIGLTADCLLRENLITGPVHAAMTTQAILPPLLGVDDPIHYNANVNAYRQSAPKIDGFKKDLAARKFNLEKVKTSVFSPALSAFDAKVTAYKEERLPLSDYVIALAPEPGAGQAGLFLQALSVEKKVDFQKVEADRKQLIETLVKNLSKTQTDQLVQESAGYRMGQVRYGEFYRDLQSLCRSAKIDLARYPHMDAYIRYVLISDRIDAEKLVDELAALQTARYQTLAKTPVEKDLVAQSTALQLTARLLDFALTPAEWAEYEQLHSKPAGFSDLTSFEAFYKEAHVRDAAITENLLRTMDKDKVNTAVLVTGGYHSPGVADRLRQAGVTVISFTPRIEKVDTLQGSAYLSVFTQEKTPLEKLFAGEKLFVSPNPASLTVAPSLGSGINFLLKKSASTAQKIFNALSHDQSKMTVKSENDQTTLVTVTREGTQGAAQVEVTKGKDGLFHFIQKTAPPAVGLALALTFSHEILSAFSAFAGPLSHAILSDPNLKIAMTVLLLASFFFFWILSQMAPDGAPRFTIGSFKNEGNKDSGLRMTIEEIEDRYHNAPGNVKANATNKAGSSLGKRRNNIGNLMRRSLTKAFLRIIKDTRKIQDGLVSFPILFELSKWKSLPQVELAALRQMTNNAYNEDPQSEPSKRLLRILEIRAVSHLEWGEIVAWEGIHGILDQWGNRQRLNHGDTNFTDWDARTFLTFYLKDFETTATTMTELDLLLRNKPGHFVRGAPAREALKHSLRTRGIAEGMTIVSQANRSQKMAKEVGKNKMALANRSGEMDKAIDDEAFFDRLLYLLLTAYDKAKIDQKGRDFQFNKEFVESMVEILDVTKHEEHKPAKSKINPPGPSRQTGLSLIIFLVLVSCITFFAISALGMSLDNNGLSPAISFAKTLLVRFLAGGAVLVAAFLGLRNKFAEWLKLKRDPAKPIMNLIVPQTREDRLRTTITDLMSIAGDTKDASAASTAMGQLVTLFKRDIQARYYFHEVTQIFNSNLRFFTGALPFRVLLTNDYLRDLNKFVSPLKPSQIETLLKLFLVSRIENDEAANLPSFSELNEWRVLVRHALFNTKNSADLVSLLGLDSDLNQFIELFKKTLQQATSDAESVSRVGERLFIYRQMIANLNNGAPPPMKSEVAIKSPLPRARTPQPIPGNGEKRKKTREVRKKQPKSEESQSGQKSELPKDNLVLLLRGFLSKFFFLSQKGENPNPDINESFPPLATGLSPELGNLFSQMNELNNRTASNEDSGAKLADIIALQAQFNTFLAPYNLYALRVEGARGFGFVFFEIVSSREIPAPIENGEGSTPKTVYFLKSIDTAPHLGNGAAFQSDNALAVILNERVENHLVFALNPNAPLSETEFGLGQPMMSETILALERVRHLFTPEEQSGIVQMADIVREMQRMISAFQREHPQFHPPLVPLTKRSQIKQFTAWQSQAENGDLSDYNQLLDTLKEKLTQLEEFQETHSACLQQATGAINTFESAVREGLSNELNQIGSQDVDGAGAFASGQWEVIRLIRVFNIWALDNGVPLHDYPTSPLDENFVDRISALPLDGSLGVEFTTRLIEANRLWREDIQEARLSFQNLLNDFGSHFGAPASNPMNDLVRFHFGTVPTEKWLYYLIFPHVFSHEMGHLIAGIIMGLTWDKVRLSSKPLVKFLSPVGPRRGAIIALAGGLGNVLLVSLSFFLTLSGSFGDFELPARILGTIGHISTLGYLYVIFTKKHMSAPEKHQGFFVSSDEELLSMEINDSPQKRDLSDGEIIWSAVLSIFFGNKFKVDTFHALISSNQPRGYDVVKHISETIRSLRDDHVALSTESVWEFVSVRTYTESRLNSLSLKLNQKKAVLAERTRINIEQRFNSAEQDFHKFPIGNPIDFNQMIQLYGILANINRTLDRVDGMLMKSQGPTDPPSPPPNDSSNSADQINENVEKARELGNLDNLLRQTIISPTSNRQEEPSVAKKMMGRGINSTKKEENMGDIEGFLSGGIDAPMSEAIIPLPESIINDPDTLTKYIHGARARYGKAPILFLVESETFASKMRGQLIGNARVEVAAKLFDGTTFNLAPVEGHLPTQGMAVTIYKPKKFNINDAGVHDKRLDKNKLVNLESLAELMDRLWRIAELIANQA